LADITGAKNGVMILLAAYKKVLVGAGALALGGLIAFSKHRPVMTNKPPVSWLTQEEGIEAMLDSAMDANKAADRLILDHGFNNKHGAGTDHNAVKKWLDRIIRKIIKKSLK
jgi:hypothetical protein